jgi:hypothetical protein
MTTRTRWAVAAGSAGLAAGLALGVTGFATAASPEPSPSSPTATAADRPFGGMHRDRGMHLRGAGGLVTAVDADSVTLSTPDGSKTVALTSSTTYYVGRTAATKAAVTVGKVVHVRLADPRATKPVASVVVVVPAHVAGWVSSVSGSTVTVTDVSGFTRTIRTSSSTTYVKDGTTATSSILTKGAFVRAVGTVDADGTTLVASRVATGRPDRGDGPGDGPDGAGMMGGI